MKIFYDISYDTYDILLKPRRHEFACYDGKSNPRTWVYMNHTSIGTRQIPDTVLVLVGAPELEPVNVNA